LATQLISLSVKMTPEEELRKTREEVRKLQKENKGLERENKNLKKRLGGA